MPKKNETQLESVESVRWVEELWRKWFVEKMSFQPAVEEGRSNGWWQWWRRKWRTDVCEIRSWEWSLRDQQAGEVPCEADSRDRVMRDGKSGCYALCHNNATPFSLNAYIGRCLCLSSPHQTWRSVLFATREEAWQCFQWHVCCMYVIR